MTRFIIVRYLTKNRPDQAIRIKWCVDIKELYIPSQK